METGMGFGVAVGGAVFPPPPRPPALLALNEKKPPPIAKSRVGTAATADAPAGLGRATPRVPGSSSRRGCRGAGSPRPAPAAVMNAMHPSPQGLAETTPPSSAPTPSRAKDEGMGMAEADKSVHVHSVTPPLKNASPDGRGKAAGRRSGLAFPSHPARATSSPQVHRS